MQSITHSSINRKIINIIQTRRQFVKNIRNYLQFMEDRCMISEYRIRVGEKQQVHVDVQLFGQPYRSFTFHPSKVASNEKTYR